LALIAGINRLAEGLVLDRDFLDVPLKPERPMVRPVFRMWHFGCLATNRFNTSVTDITSLLRRRLWSSTRVTGHRNGSRSTWVPHFKVIVRRLISASSVKGWDRIRLECGGSTIPLTFVDFLREFAKLLGLFVTPLRLQLR
jgi:hypothetical protein